MYQAVKVGLNKVESRMVALLGLVLHNHPSIIPVINLNVFKTRATRVAFLKLRDSMQKLEIRCNMLDSLHTCIL